MQFDHHPYNHLQEMYYYALKETLEFHLDILSHLECSILYLMKTTLIIAFSSRFLFSLSSHHSSSLLARLFVCVIIPALKNVYLKIIGRERNERSM